MFCKGVPFTIWTSLLWIQLLFIITVEGGDYFDCRRDGQNCANSKVCLEGGVNAGYCDCDGSDYSGYDCGVTESLKNTGPCTSLTDHCGTDGGVCYDNSGTAACHCPEGSYGDQCEIKRFEVTCSTSSMLIVMNPFGTFSGVIYVDGQKDTAGCSFSTNGLPSGRQGLVLNIPDADCGGVTTISATNRSRDVIVQHNSKYMTSVDSKVKVTCGEGTNTVDVQTEFTSDTTDGNLKNQNIDNTPTFESSMIQFNVKLKDGTEVSTAVPLDDLLTFEFIADPATTTCTFTEYADMTGDENNFVGFQDNKSKQECQDLCKNDDNCKAVEISGTDCGLYDVSRANQLVAKSGSTYMEKVCVNRGTEAIRIESCTANNKQSGADLETLKIIENSCPSAEIGKLMKQNPARSPDTTVTFKLQPFKFNKETAVSVSCIIKVCPITKATFCDDVVCGASTRRRKRRSSDFSDVTVEKSFTTVAPRSDLGTGISGSSSETCDPEVNLTTPIIAGVATVTLLMILICLLILVLLKKKRAARKSKSKKESVCQDSKEFQQNRMYPFIVTKQ